MTIEEIRNKVRTLMNETGEYENLALLSEDTVKLDDYINACIPDAINAILLATPIRYLNPTSYSSNVTSESDGSSVIKLPSDFLRLCSVKFSEWKRAVFTVFPEDSEEHKMQHNPITTAGKNKPRCAYSYNANGKVIECFPAGTFDYMFYIKSSSGRDSDLSQIKEAIHPSICYMCAGLVYDIFEIPATSEKMKAIAIGLIPQE